MNTRAQPLPHAPRAGDPRVGYFYAGLNAVISGFAIYVNSLGVKLFSDSTLYTTLKNTVVGVALLIPLLFLARQRAELVRLNPRQWGYLLALALIGGSVPYALYFRGLQLTTSVTGSLVYHAQFLIVAVLAVFLLRERVGALLWLALVVLLAGTALGLNLHVVRLGQGDVLLVFAAALFAVGVVLAKYLLRELSTLTVMAAKMSVGSVFLLVYVAATGRFKAVSHLSGLQWEFVLVTGLILLAFTVTAFLGLRYASATAVTAIPAASPIITALLVAASSQRIKLAPVDGLGLLLTLIAVAGIFVVGQRAEHRTWQSQQKEVVA